MQAQMHKWEHLDQTRMKRMKVPGGWLYKDDEYQGHMVFIPETTADFVEWAKA